MDFFNSATMIIGSLLALFAAGIFIGYKTRWYIQIILFAFLSSVLIYFAFFYETSMGWINLDGMAAYLFFIFFFSPSMSGIILGNIIRGIIHWNGTKDKILSFVPKMTRNPVFFNFFKKARKGIFR